jgi:hypothetical protein
MTLIAEPVGAANERPRQAFGKSFLGWRALIADLFR